MTELEQLIYDSLVAPIDYPDETAEKDVEKLWEEHRKVFEQVYRETAGRIAKAVLENGYVKGDLVLRGEELVTKIARVG
jgi:hypothetical protein